MTRRRSGVALVTIVTWVMTSTLAALFAWPASHAVAAAPASGFYLAIGGSSSLGYEPTGRLTKDGALLDVATSRGYANDLVTLEAPHIALALSTDGCAAETVETLLGEADQCYKFPTTQMSTARSFLRAHASDVGVVTIDIGFNDIRPCLATAVVELECVHEALAVVKQDLPKVVAKLTSVAGPSVHFVGIEYEDPFISRYLLGASEKTYVQQTLAAMTELNGVLGNAYAASNVAIASDARTFKSSSETPTRLAHVGVVPTNVAEICTYTFMCRAYPWGPDDHPNDAGYRDIAQEIVNVLPSSW